MTNREWLNTLSDTALAEWLGALDCCLTCPAESLCKETDGSCVPALIAWLNAEHKEGV